VKLSGGQTAFGEAGSRRKAARSNGNRLTRASARP